MDLIKIQDASPQKKGDGMVEVIAELQRKFSSSSSNDQSPNIVNSPSNELKPPVPMTGKISLFVGIHD